MGEVEVNTALMRAALSGIAGTARGNGDHFFRLMQFHRISGRGLEVRDEVQDALSDAQWQQVFEVRKGELDEIDLAMRRRAMFSRQLPRRSPFIQLKGISAYEHLGQLKSRLRPSNDLDIIGADVVPLSKMGYRRFKSGICHELGAFSHDSLPWIDLHEYFPSWRIENGMVKSRRIDLDTIRNHSKWSQCWSGKLRIPDITMTCLIICSHLYADYIEHPMLREAPVRLAEIFEFEELSRHPDFDPHVFDELAGQFDAADAVQFVHNVTQIIAGGCEATQAWLEVARGILTQIQLGASEAYDSSCVFAQIAQVPHVVLTAASGTSVTANALTAPEAGCWNKADHLSDLPRMAVRLTRSDPDHVRLEVHVDLVSRFYKDELRVTLEAGSAGIQRDPIGGSTEEFGTGLVEWDFKADSIGDHLRIDLRLELPAGAQTRAIISSHSFPSEVNDDWNDFYNESLASGYIVALLEG